MNKNEMLEMQLQVVKLNEQYYDSKIIAHICSTMTSMLDMLNEFLEHTEVEERITEENKKIYYDKTGKIHPEIFVDKHIKSIEECITLQSSKSIEPLKSNEDSGSHNTISYI